ncbi:AzlC family ABC transporter permease [Pasteurella atlantica]|uniref:AzlC family ABC transporter permease n=1 Tax=Pasteurella atlantica TaxID=2827233 RepID=UPI00278C0C7F|nr:AzlC family ABC transporter permease [Pasteurella atlantica]MDP8088452.1 AzlC family ABC transporter permease [Pasteurella atlantica]
MTEKQTQSFLSKIIYATFAVLPLAISAIPWGILCGTLSIQAGLSSMQAQIMSLLVFSGTIQLSGIAILGAGGSWLGLVNNTIKQVTALIDSSYFWAGICAILFSIFIKHTFTVIILSMVAFYGLRTFL